ncbi:hypothetical protein DPMN_042848 [Dreissena polymorpha]|uniref:PWI domain-containing protein n=1 Tax=Dreissena polymorpha TaxID=45954 RepID=A0A9D4HV33_DREPO|nr:hypothetical protein DPMN_042848 [Dreissena polymorpha]
MADAGFFKGTSADQDNRFADKKKKLMKQMKFSENVETKVDMTKVNVDTMKPWIATRVTELLAAEDDVVVEFVYNQLEARINLTGFLNAKNARIFMGELWELLCSAQENIGGIPAKFVEQKKEEIKKRQEEQERITASLKVSEEQIRAAIMRERENAEKREGEGGRRERSRSPRRSRFDKSASRSPRRESKKNGAGDGNTIDGHTAVPLVPLQDKEVSSNAEQLPTGGEERVKNGENDASMERSKEGITNRPSKERDDKKRRSGSRDRRKRSRSGDRDRKRSRSRDRDQRRDGERDRKHGRRSRSPRRSPRHTSPRRRSRDRQERGVRERSPQRPSPSARRRRSPPRHRREDSRGRSPIPVAAKKPARINEVYTQA